MDRRDVLALGAIVSSSGMDDASGIMPARTPTVLTHAVNDTHVLAKISGQVGEVIVTQSYDAALAPGVGGARYALTRRAAGKRYEPRWAFASSQPELVWLLSEARPDPAMFGAIGDGEVDDTDALVAGLGYLAATFGGGELQLAARRYRTRSISLSNATGIVGSRGGFASQSPATLTSSVYTLLLEPGATITMHEATVLQGVVIRAYGMTFPQSQPQVTRWSGTAITIAPESAGVHIGRCMIVGFAQAILAAGKGPIFRTRIEDLSIDCLSGISLSFVPDVAYLTRIHAWNFATTGAGDRNFTARPGAAFRFANRADWAKITDCFCYGYEIGFELEDVADCTLTGCGADHKPGRQGEASSIGFKLHGRARNNRLVACQAAAQGRGIHIATDPNEPRLTNHLQGGTLWDNLIGLEISGGHTIASDLALRVRGGVLIGSAAGGGRLSGLSFEGVPSPQVRGDPTAIERFATAIITEIP